MLINCYTKLTILIVKSRTFDGCSLVMKQLLKPIKIMKKITNKNMTRFPEIFTVKFPMFITLDY